MEFRYQKLQQDLGTLKSSFEALAHQLAEAAHEVGVKGTMPGERLAEGIASARRQFDAVRSAVFALAQDMLVPSVPALDNLRSLPAVEQLLAEASASETQRYSAESEQGRALAVLDQVLRLRHRDSPDFKPLADCQRQARELRQAIAAARWPQTHPETATLLGGGHAFNALLTLVAKGDELDDESYARLDELVTDAFGRTLGVAVTRGKLTEAGGAAEEATPVPAAAVAPPTPPPPPVADLPKVESLVAEPVPVVAAAPNPFPAPVSLEMEAAPVAPPAAEPVLAEAPPAAPPEAEPEPPVIVMQAEPEPALPKAEPAASPNDTVELAREEIAQAVASHLDEPAASPASEPEPEPARVAATDATVALAEAVTNADASRAAAETPESASPLRPALKTEDKPGESGTAARPQRWGFWRGNR
jgi:hypothetical protein